MIPLPWHMCGASLACFARLHAPAAAGLQARTAPFKTHTWPEYTCQATHAQASRKKCRESVFLCAVAKWQASAGEWTHGSCQLYCAKDLTHMALQHQLLFSRPARRPPAYAEHQLTSQEEALYLAKPANGTTALAGWCLPLAHYSSRPFCVIVPHDIGPTRPLPASTSTDYCS